MDRAASTEARLALPFRAVVHLILGGCALGLAARAADGLGPRWIGNVAAAWFLAGFLAGRTVRVPKLGARAGMMCLSIGTGAYYALRLIIDPISLADLAPIPLWWLVVGAGTGFVAGWLGARSHRWEEAWGAPAGVFLGEALAILVLRQRMVQVVIECSCAGACLRLARRRWKRGLALAAASIPYVAGFAAVYRVALW
jgi:hypothetical protein